MPRMKPDDVAEFLAQPHIGVLATLRRDGRPYPVPVWFLHHDEAWPISRQRSTSTSSRSNATRSSPTCVLSTVLLFRLTADVFRAIDMRIYRERRRPRAPAASPCQR